MKSSSIKFLLIILTVAMMLAACSPAAPEPRKVAVENLYTGSWHLVAYGNADELSIVTPGLRTFVSFQQDGSLFGNAGCNNFFGSFSAAQDGSFSVEEPLGSTMMMCIEFMDEEAAFLAALQSADGFYFNENNQLVISIADAEAGFDSLLLVNQQNQPLVGTGWVLESLISPNGEIAVPPASAPLLNFSEDGSVSGFGGCNRIMSEFTFGEGSISIGLVASSMMFCDGQMELEAGYTEGLSQVTSYEITGERLVLSDDSMTTVMTFSAAGFELTGTQWRLVVINGENIPENIMPTLTLSPGENQSEGTVFGSTGCNRYSGTYTLDGDRLNVNVLVVSAMFCDEAMDTETAFLAALQDELTFQIEFNRLNLISDMNGLVFLGEAPDISGPWRVNLLGDPQNPVELTFEQTILAEFSIQEGANTGLLSGTTPCQEFNARFFIDRNYIIIGTPDLKDINQCQAESELDTQFFEALGNAALFEFNLGNLILRDGDGNHIIEFATQFR